MGSLAWRMVAAATAVARLLLYMMIQEGETRGYSKVDWKGHTCHTEILF